MNLLMKTMSAIVCRLCAAAVLLSYVAFAQQRPGEAATTAPNIPGVVAGGTPVQLAWVSLQNADGIISEADGNL